jgi:hypothetical protein
MVAARPRCNAWVDDSCAVSESAILAATTAAAPRLSASAAFWVGRSGFSVSDVGFRVSGFGFRVSIFGYRISGAECRAEVCRV